MVKLFKALPALFFATLAAADLQITKPGPDNWWVAKSQNLLEWSCQSSTYTQFTVLITNSDRTLYPSASPLAIIAIQQNYQCSLLVTQDQANQPAGTGWQILFADPLNNTNVYASSQPFEIKALGSLYPTQVTAALSSAAATASGSASKSAASAKSTSGALGIRTIGLGGVGAALAGLAAFLA